MEILDITKLKVTLDMTESELLILSSALNEICNGIDVPEFDTRIGASKDDAASLLERVNSLLDKMLLIK